MHRIRQATTIVAALTSLAAAAAPATAASPFNPAVITDATSGTETVSAAIYVSTVDAQLLGVWNQPGIGCATVRKLRITGRFFYTPSPAGHGRHYAITRTFKVRNCAEGGPNTGFTLRAVKRRAVCPGGRWHPGEYQMQTVVTDIATGLKTSAYTDFTITRPCSAA
jgi:hypothetical protein